MKHGLLFFLITTLIIPNVQINVSGTNHFSALVLYNSQNDKMVIEDLYSNFTDVANINFVSIAAFDFNLLTDYSYAILASSDEFKVSSDDEIKLLNFIQTSGTTFVVISPYLNEFGDLLESELGIDLDSVYPEDDESVIWTIKLNQDTLSYNANDEFQYEGEIATITASTGYDIVASITSSNSVNGDITDLTYPLPIIVEKRTVTNQVISSGIAIADPSGEGPLQFDQLNIILDLLLDLVTSSIEFHQSQVVMNNQQSNGSNSPSETNPQDQSGLNINPPNIDPRIFIIFLVALVFLFIKQILGVLRWLSEKFWGIAIAVVGAFYNVQDRILDDNDILLNQSRVEIMDYLDYLGAFGAHLREIKAITKMGTGSLLWHLQVLEDFNWITKFKVNKYTVFVSIDSIDKFQEEFKEVELSLQSKHSKPIINAMIAMGSNEISVDLLESETNLSRKAIRRFLRKLYDLEIIDIIFDKPLVVKIDDIQTLQLLEESIQKRTNYSISRSEVNVQSTN